MEKVFKVVEGIKLYPRTCSVCKTMEFWVPKSSKQETCGMFCEMKRRKTKTGFIRKSGEFTDKVKRSDYDG